jgi:hypothetical protein
VSHVVGPLLIVFGLAMIAFVYAKTDGRRGRMFSIGVPFVGLIGAVALLAGIALVLTWVGAVQAHEIIG